MIIEWYNDIDNDTDDDQNNDNGYENICNCSLYELITSIILLFIFI